MKPLSLLSILILFASCQLSEPSRVPKLYLSFTPRDVNYVWIKPTAESGELKIIVSTYNQLMHGENDARYAYAETWQQIDQAIPELEAAYKKSKYTYDDTVYISISEQAEHVRKEEQTPDVGYDRPVLPDLVEYRTDRMASLSITADRSFCGRVAGNELNDLFFIHPAYPGFYASGQIFTPTETLSLNVWISRDPYVPEVGVFTMDRELTPTERQATITVAMTTTSGKHFRTSHKIAINCQSGITKYLHTDFFCSIADEYLATRTDE